MERIGIDIDGVLRDIMPNINKVFQTHYPDCVVGEIAYNWDFPQFDMSMEKKYDIIFNEFPEDIFLHSNPYPDSKKRFDKLKLWAKNNNAKLICVTTQEPHLICMTYKWLGMHEFDFEEVHITRDKGGVGLDYLIDDAPHNYENWMSHGNKETNFFLVDRDWNQDVNSTRRIKNIDEILGFLK